MNEHSKRYEQVKGYYDRLWSAKRVRDAVTKGWITQAECDETLGGGT